MSYGPALSQAWSEISALTNIRRFLIKFLSDLYDIDIDNKTILSQSCNVPAKDYVTIIILHYLIRKLKLSILPEPAGEWIDFNSLEGGEAYYPAFRKRTINHILKKYGSRPDELLEAMNRLPAEKARQGDVGIIIYPLEKIPILITVWKADEEFGPDANILFDKNIRDTFCTEDIVVLTEIVAHAL